MKKIQELISLKIVKYILGGTGLLVLLLAVFGCGMYVGFSKARFSYQWGENYHRIFGGPQLFGPPPRDLPRKMGGMMNREIGVGFINPNSAAGVVIRFDSSTLYIKGNDNVERSIIVNDQTVIRQGRNNISVIDLKTDDQVVVLGTPSSTGQIEAKLIRVFNK